MRNMLIHDPTAAVKTPGPAFHTPAIVCGSLALAGSAYLCHALAPDVISTRAFLAISAATLIFMAGAVLFTELTEFTWGQLFTAKALFLLGSIVFLGGGEISSALLSDGYSKHPEKYVLLTSGYMLIGTACFLAGYGMGAAKRAKGKTSLPALPSVRLWLGAMLFWAIWAVGSIKAHTYSGPKGTHNPWGHLVEFGIPSGVMLVVLLLRKSSSPIKRLVAGLFLSPLLFQFATTWSRRPLQTVLLGGLAYYVVTKGLGRRRQLRLLLLVGIAFLMVSVFQVWYRQIAYKQHRSLESANSSAALDKMKGLVEKGRLIDTFGVAAAATTIYSTGQPYLYGRSFLALLVNPVPRVYWPGKPVGFGYTLSKEVFHTNHPWTNLGPSIEGELFANGGVWTVFWGMFLIGLACYWYDSFLLGRGRTEASVLIHALGVYQFFFWVRGDFLDVGYIFLITVVPAMVFLHLPDPSSQPITNGETCLSTQSCEPNA